MRQPAPPYSGEGPHALWHVSEDSAIERFEPHVSATAARDEPLVWAIDTRHLPMYWFPRDCPRGTFWATPATSPEDAEGLLFGAARVHAVEAGWLERIELGDLLARHAEAGIELRLVANLWPLWDRVVASTLEYSGMRLRNASPRPG